ncbi:zinc finger BED domain-containing protein 4-like isoform X2 [Pseudophryne corroboree]|uniref:zinc finger BED domain-containing protein 4-like isoform X2 n=1 Tax=Pseudophryne corroboree TaxID=495146 RepID=UPI0030821A56
MRQKNNIWEYFDRPSDSVAICKFCGKQLKFVSTTSNLRQHLVRKHPDALQLLVPAAGVAKPRFVNVDGLILNVVQVSEEAEATTNGDEAPRAEPGPSAPKAKRAAMLATRIHALDRYGLSNVVTQGQVHLAGQSQVHLAGQSQVHLAGQSQVHLAGQSQVHLAGQSQVHLTCQSQVHLAAQSQVHLEEQGHLAQSPDPLAAQSPGPVAVQIPGPLVTQAVVDMVCKDSQPTYIVENAGFNNLLKTLAPHYDVPTRKSINQHVMEKYNTLSGIMRKKLVNKKCTLTTDVWTDDQMQSFLSLTIHAYDEDELLSGTIGVLPLEEGHTSESLAERLKQCCLEWGIRPETEDVTAIVTDGDGNIKKAAELAFGEEKHIPCFVHSLHLVVGRCLGIETMSPLLSKSKAILTWFKQSVGASDELRQISENRLIQLIPKRWNATCHVFQQLRELQPYISEVIDQHPSAPPMLTASEFEDVNEILDILEPFEAAIRQISGEHYLTSSLVIPITSIILQELEKLHPNSETPKAVLNEAISAMKERFGSVEHVFLLAVATVLDPRFKKLYFRDPTALSKQVTFLSNWLTKDSAESAKGNDLSGSSPESEDVQKPKRSLFSDHNKIVQNTWQQHEEPTSSELPQELSIYLGRKKKLFPDCECPVLCSAGENRGEPS